MLQLYRHPTQGNVAAARTDGAIKMTFSGLKFNTLANLTMAATPMLAVVIAFVTGTLPL